MISPEIIKEFQQAIKEEYGNELTLANTSLILNDLVSYFDTLSKIYHRVQKIQENGTVREPD